MIISVNNSFLDNFPLNSEERKIEEACCTQITQLNEKYKELIKEYIEEQYELNRLIDDNRLRWDAKLASYKKETRSSLRKRSRKLRALKKLESNCTEGKESNDATRQF